MEDLSLTWYNWFTNMAHLVIYYRNFGCLNWSMVFSRRGILNNVIFMNRLDMRFTVAFLSECIRAVGTLIWFFTRMNTNMGLHEWWSFHYFWTVGARVLSITAVNGLDRSWTGSILQWKWNFLKARNPVCGREVVDNTSIF